MIDFFFVIAHLKIDKIYFQYFLKVMFHVSYYYFFIASRITEYNFFTQSKHYYNTLNLMKMLIDVLSFSDLML